MSLLKRAALSLLLLTATASLFGQSYQDPFQVLSSRARSIGGTHAADACDMGTIFNNPAGFQTVEPQVAFSELTLGLSGPVFDIADLVIQVMVGGEDVSDVMASDSTKELLSGLYAGLGMIGPLYFGYVGNGLGLGVFGNTDVTFEEAAPLTLGITLDEELMLCGGYSYRIALPETSPHTLDLGILLKGGVRGSVEVTESFASLLTLDISPDTILNSPFTLTAFIGMDVGILYNYNDFISVGITAMDLFSPTSVKTYNDLNGMISGSESPLTTETGTIPISLNTGVGITPPLGPLDKYVSDFKIFLDYKDLLGVWLYQENYSNPWLHFSAGMELTLLEIFALRGGLDQGLLSAGLGVDLSLFTMNIAMFGSELGTEPGMRPVYNLMLGFEFRY